MSIWSFYLFNCEDNYDLINMIIRPQLMQRNLNLNSKIYVLIEIFGYVSIGGL